MPDVWAEILPAAAAYGRTVAVVVVAAAAAAADSETTCLGQEYTLHRHSS
jgi:hypothetical protein